MDKQKCPLCPYFVSDWQIETGKTIKSADKEVHIACAMKHNLSVAQLEQRVRELEAR